MNKLANWSRPPSRCQSQPQSRSPVSLPRSPTVSLSPDGPDTILEQNLEHYLEHHHLDWGLNLPGWMELRSIRTPTSYQVAKDQLKASRTCSATNHPPSDQTIPRHYHHPSSSGRPSWSSGALLARSDDAYSFVPALFCRLSVR